MCLFRTEFNQKAVFLHSLPLAMTPVMKVKHHMVTANRASLCRSSEVQVRHSSFLLSAFFLGSCLSLPPPYITCLVSHLVLFCFVHLCLGNASHHCTRLYSNKRKTLPSATFSFSVSYSLVPRLALKILFSSSSWFIQLKHM